MAITEQQKKERLQKFEQEWTENMGKYWQERIEKLRLIDTGRLYSDIRGAITPGPVVTIEHSFLLYGEYMARGVGRNFKKSKDANGRIPFLLPGGEDYRHEHGLDKPKPIGPAWHRSKNSPGDPSKREAGGRPVKYDPTTGYYEGRDWFSKKYYSSRIRLAEYEMFFYGDAWRGMVTEAFDELLKKRSLI